MSKAIQITVLLLLTAGVTFAAEAKSATMLLQEGIYAEETEGNLDKAIGIYQEAAKSAQATEKAAAEATFRTGLCYLKKGDKAAATKQFEAVVKKYPSQTAIVAQANKQLSALGANLDSQLPQDVLDYLGAQQTKHVKEADKLNDIPTNARVYGLDSDMNLFEGGMIVYFNKTGKTLNGEINVGGTSYGNAIGVGSKIRVEKSNRNAGPAYNMYWTTEGNLEPNCFAIIGWEVPNPMKLAVGADGKASVAMQNFYGPECLESFYLLVPKGFKVNSLVPATAQAELSEMDVYEWTKKIAKSTNHKLTVQVTGGNAAAAKPLEIGPVPWTDGEICRLVLKTKADMAIGTLYYMPSLVKEGGKDVWQLDSFQFISIQSQEQFTRVQADAATFAPIASRTMNKLGDFVAAYEPGKVTLSTTVKGKTTTRDTTVSGPVFDNEQVLMLIRRLPLAEGYTASFQIFPVVGGTPVECRIAVDGKEDVTVAYGSSPCWKVTLGVYSGTIKALEHTLYFSADEKKLLMKYDAGTAVMELAEVSKAQPQTVISDKENGVSFTLPAGWMASQDGVMGSYKPYVAIANDGLETWACFAGTQGQATDLNTTVDGEITTLKGFFKDYVVRTDSRHELTVDGVPAIRYTADYNNDGKAMVEYRTYLVKNGAIYWFVFRIEKDKFDANQAAYDAIVSSLRVAGK